MNAAPRGGQMQNTDWEIGQSAIHSDVHAAFAKLLDRIAIQTARWSVRTASEWSGVENQAAASLAHPDFFAADIGAPKDLEFQSARAFRFTSAVTTPWAENNIAFGKLFRCREQWTQFPTVIMLHGWNASLSYRCLFPRLAARLMKRDVNVLTLELPYHEHRQPRRNGTRINFISSDIAQMLEATQQAVTDTRALIAWLTEQGCPSVGLWGISLGAWLAGLVTCLDSQNQFSVLLTPIARLDRVVRELPFCAPIRRSLERAPIDLRALDLAVRHPRIPARDILIVACEHDLFAPLETMTEIREAWSQPEFWRIPQGHISVLFSLRTLDRIIRWIARAGFSAMEGSRAHESR